MKKRIVYFVLAMCLLSLVACQNSTSDNTESSSGIQTQTESETLLSRDRDVYADDVTVEMLKRTPSKYIDKEFKLTGNIVAELKYDGEVEDGNGNVHSGEESSEYIASYYLSVGEDDNDFNNYVVLMYYRDYFDFSLLVGDNVTVYGALLEGNYEFKAINGTITTMPAVIAVMIDLNN